MQEYQFFLIPYCPAFRASQTKSVISANILCYCYYQFCVSNIAVFVVVKVNDTLFLNTQIGLVLCIHVCRWKIADLRVFFTLSNSYYTIRREGWTFWCINSFGKKINRIYFQCRESQNPADMTKCRLTFWRVIHWMNMYLQYYVIKENATT